MKNRFIRKIFITSTLLLSLAFTGCSSNTKISDSNSDSNLSDTVTFTNLNDSKSRELLSRLMDNAGVAKDKQTVLFDHVDQINELLSDNELTDGFETHKITSSKYDPYDLQEKWTEKYPDFLGYNCRITAYSMLSDFINTNVDKEVRSDLLMLDIDSLTEDSSAATDGTLKFQQIFSSIPTTNTKDVDVHINNLKKDWENRGLSFKDNDKMSMVSVVLHDQIDDDQLFIGHVGTLFNDDDGQLYFLEKIAFQEPYQLCQFNNKKELSDYLMTKYNTDYNQPTAAPIILENDNLIEGYTNGDL